MFNCADYKLLDENLQAQLLWMHGTFLMARKTEKITAELFSLYDFYVEIFFAEDEDPLFIKPFENICYLYVYLKSINIDAAFENMK